MKKKKSNLWLGYIRKIVKNAFWWQEEDKVKKDDIVQVVYKTNLHKHTLDFTVHHIKGSWN